MLKKYLNNKSKKIRLVSRIIIFAFIFLILSAILYPLLSLLNFSIIYARMLSSLFGGEIINQGITLLIQNIQINILEVCSGTFELAVFISLIIATIDVPLRKRIYGILVLIPLFFIFNLLRMIITILIILNSNIFVIELTHSVLFKIGFFIFFGVFYYLWFKISVGDIRC